jgi:LytS/YehU family sensor histidine kinase
MNPHFFFNSLNTLYATISRDNIEAKRLVLNLAEVFHYLVRSDRTFVSLKQELAIINAYLEIEKLRLGPRLTTSIQIDEDLLEAKIPVLAIQPLVENAVKHGVAPCSNNGFVGLTIKSENARLKIEVSNTGKFGSNRSLNGAGVGLDNVQRRLALCYGFEAELHIFSKENLTLVCCSMPLSIPVSNNRPTPMMKNTVPGDIMGKTA